MSLREVTASVPAASHRPVPFWRRKGLLWGTFAVLVLMIAVVTRDAAPYPIGDVDAVYRRWVHEALSRNIPGIHQPFVYPILALVPMYLAYVLGGDALFNSMWLALFTAGCAAMMAMLTRPSRDVAAAERGGIAAWWWLAFMVAIGPVLFSRIDGFTAPLAVIAMLWVGRRPAVSAALLTALGWCKIWTVAPFLAAVATHGRRGVRVAAAVALTASILLVALLAGGETEIFSFLTGQNGRGLQAESVAAVPFIWLAHVHPETWGVYFDTHIISHQVFGPGAADVARFTGWVLPALIIVPLAAPLLARRREVPLETLFAPLALALTSALILGNKVGSPQFVSWLGAVLVMGIAMEGRRFAVPAVITLVTAYSAQLLYPWNFDALTMASRMGVVLVTLRALGILALFVWSLVELVRRLRPGAKAQSGRATGPTSPSLVASATSATASAATAATATPATTATATATSPSTATAISTV